MTITTTWLTMLLVPILLRLLTRGKLKIEYVTFTILRMCLLIAIRLSVGAFRVTKSKVAQFLNRKNSMPVRPVKVTSVLDIERRYNLKPFEVVMGFDGVKPIRVNLAKHHTLIAGVTGFGKSMMIHFILAQLLNKGQRFMSQAEVYLLDLKGAEEDYFENWKPMLKGYYSITSDEDGVRQAIVALTNIIEQMHGNNKAGNKKRIFVFIDELAMLTIMSSNPNLRREAEAALERLAGQLRFMGNIVGATQYPKGTVIPTTVRFNMARRISFHVETVTELEVVLGFRPKEKDKIIPQNEGEFILREPGKTGLRTGKTLLVDLPGDIDKVVFRYIDMKAADDDRLKLFMEATAGTQMGDKVKGINVISKGFKGTFNVQQIKLAYRHYALAGAFLPPKVQGQGYVMAADYPAAFDKVVKYIAAGNWAKDPISLIGEEIEDERKPSPVQW